MSVLNSVLFFTGSTKGWTESDRTMSPGTGLCDIVFQYALQIPPGIEAWNPLAGPLRNVFYNPMQSCTAMTIQWLGHKAVSPTTNS